MKSPRAEILEDCIEKLNQVKHLMEKELHYDWSATDEIQQLIEHMEFDLGEQE